MRLRFPPYLLLLLAACAGTEVGNPTFACGGEDAAKGGIDPSNGGSGGSGGNGGNSDGIACDADGSDCGLAASLNSFSDATCPGGTGRTALYLANLTDARLSGAVVVSDDAAVEVVPDRFDLEPHGDTTLAVIFAPPADASAGVDGAILRIVLDGTPHRELAIEADGFVDPESRTSVGVLCGNDAPCATLDVGTVAVGETGTTPFTVVNDGCDELWLLAPDLGPDGRLSLVDPPEFPAPVPPRGRLLIQVGFTPAAVGPTGGDVSLSTTDGASQTLPWQGVGR